MRHGPSFISCIAFHRVRGCGNLCGHHTIKYVPPTTHARAVTQLGGLESQPVEKQPSPSIRSRAPVWVLCCGWRRSRLDVVHRERVPPSKFG